MTISRDGELRLLCNDKRRRRLRRDLLPRPRLRRRRRAKPAPGACTLDPRPGRVPHPGRRPRRPGARLVPRHRCADARLPAAGHQYDPGGRAREGAQPGGTTAPPGRRRWRDRATRREGADPTDHCAARPGVVRRRTVIAGRCAAVAADGAAGHRLLVSGARFRVGLPDPGRAGSRHGRPPGPHRGRRCTSVR